MCGIGMRVSIKGDANQEAQKAGKALCATQTTRQASAVGVGGEETRTHEERGVGAGMHASCIAERPAKLRRYTPTRGVPLPLRSQRQSIQSALMHLTDSQSNPHAVKQPQPQPDGSAAGPRSDFGALHCCCRGSRKQQQPAHRHQRARGAAPAAPAVKARGRWRVADAGPVVGVGHLGKAEEGRLGAALLARRQAPCGRL